MSGRRRYKETKPSSDEAKKLGLLSLRSTTLSGAFLFRVTTDAYMRLSEIKRICRFVIRAASQMNCSSVSAAGANTFTGKYLPLSPE